MLPSTFNFLYIYTSLKLGGILRQNIFKDNWQIFSLYETYKIWTLSIFSLSGVELGALNFGTTSGPKIDIINRSIGVGWEDTKSSVVTMQTMFTTKCPKTGLTGYMHGCTIYSSWLQVT